MRFRSSLHRNLLWYFFVSTVGLACSSSSGGNGSATGATTGSASSAGSGSGTTTGTSTGGGSATTGSSTSTGSSAGSTATGSSTTGGSASNGGSTGSTEDGLDPTEPLEPEDVCDTVELEAEFLPVDLLIMMDQSTSMTELVPSGETRWEAVRNGLEQFFSEAEVEDVRIAFDLFEGEEDLVDGKQGIYACEGVNYSTPEVELAPFEEAGTEVLDAMPEDPGGAFTPMYPALEGALIWAAANAEENPERATAVLLATDGLPTSMNQCNDSIRDISLLAQDAFESDARIRTFMLGVAVGSANLDVIAERGGGQAFVTDDETVDTQAEIVEALSTVVNQPPTCDIPLPHVDSDAGVLDRSRAQVVVTDLYDGTVTAAPLIPDPARCIANIGVDGFFFSADNVSITLCPATCNRLGRGAARLDLACRPFAPLQ